MIATIEACPLADEICFEAQCSVAKMPLRV